jgi:hypothetical protein
MAREMALVPMEMLERLKEPKPSLTPLTNPNKDQVIKNMSEVSSILHDKSLPESVKANQIDRQVKTLAVFADKILSKNTQPPIMRGREEVDGGALTTAADSAATPMLLNALPTSFRPTAKVLMEELKQHPNLISWEPTTREVSIKGKRLRGSNIIDLLGHVLRSRKSTHTPTHGNAFLKVLADLNFPEQLVKNKYQIAKFRSYKQGAGGGGARARLLEGVEEEEDEEDGLPLRDRQVIRAKKQLAGQKRKVLEGLRGPKIKKVNWKSI